MHYTKFATLLICLSLSTIAGFGQAKKFNKQLSLLIDSLKKADQSPVTMKSADSAERAFNRIIRTNFPVVNSIADKYGFPGYNLVGKESSDNYWMLVQHSDFDIAFQKRILKLMKPQVDKKNASGDKYAYLIDRININEGKPQIYGTQIIMSEAGTTIKPCADTINLDKRRLSVGLTPIKEYLKNADALFQQMNKDKLNKPGNSTKDSTTKNGM